MLRKTLITLVSVVALGLGSAAMAAHGGGGGGGGGGGHGGGGMGGGGGGGHGGGGGFGGGASFGGGGGGHGGGGGFGGGGFGRGGSFGGAGIAATPRGSAGPLMMHGGNMGLATAPMTRGRVQGWSGRTAWGRDHFHDHFHHRFHNRNFFAFGVGGPIYDYAYDSCWSWAPTRYGWQWVNVCGDYGY